MAGSKLKSNFTLTWVLVGLLSVPTLAAAADTKEGEFSMSIMNVVTFTNVSTFNNVSTFTGDELGTLLTGQVKSGSLVVGDTVCIPLKNDETAARTVDRVWKGMTPIERAEKGQIVGVMVEIDEKLVKKGALLHSNCELEEVSE